MHSHQNHLPTQHNPMPGDDTNNSQTDPEHPILAACLLTAAITLFIVVTVMA